MLHTCGDPRRRPAYAKARQGAADFHESHEIISCDPYDTEAIQGKRRDGQ